MTDRVLLLMTTSTYKASAFLEAAAKLGIAITVGTDRPQVLSAAHPAGHLTVRFLDVDAGARTIADFARVQPLRAVLAADDDGVLLAAKAASVLGLPHSPVEAVEAARNKRRTRELLAAARLNSPRFQSVSLDADPGETARGVLFPCVVKPLLLSASRGVMRADDAEQLGTSLRQLAAILAPSDAAAPIAGTTDSHMAADPGRVPVAQSGSSSLTPGSHEALIETFIPGAEVAVEGLLTAGRLKVLAIFDKPDPLDGPFFEETIYVTPSRHSPHVQQTIVSETQRAVTALGLHEGPVHAELRVNQKGVFVLEIAPRSIGGLCARTLRFSGGRSLEQLILEHALGRDVRSVEREARASGVMMIPIPRRGVLRGISGQEDAMRVHSIEDLRITIPIGQEVVPPPEGARYLGFLFARGEAPAEVEAALREAHRRLTFEIEPAERSG